MEASGFSIVQAGISSARNDPVAPIEPASLPIEAPRPVVFTAGSETLLARRALPLAVGLNVALAAAALPLARRFRRHLPEPVADMVASAVVVAVGLSALAALEHAAPREPDSVEWNDDGAEATADRAYLGLVAPAIAASARLAAIAVLGRRRRRNGPSRTWSTRVPIAARVGGALLVSELVHYWHHRLAHEVPSMWPYHAVHHSGTQLYWINAARVHPVDEVPLLFLQTLAVDLVGADRDALLVHNVAKMLHGFVQHTNVSGPGGPLSLALSTGELHRVHHAARSRSSSNYGAVLSIWDRVFGTFESAPVDPTEERVGLVGDRPYPTGVWAQMLEPVSVRRRATRGAEGPRE